MEFSRQEYWSRLPFPTPENLPKRGIKLASRVSPALAGRFFTTEPPGKSNILIKKRNLNTDALTRENAMCR